MPDDQFNLSSGTGYDAPDQPNPSPTEQTKPEVTGNPKSPDTSGSQNESDLDAVTKQLNDQVLRSREDSDKMQADMSAQVNALKQSMQQTQSPDYQPPTPPPPLNQQQKGGVAQAVMGLLKVAGLAAVAFGMQGRGRNHNNAFQAGLGSFLDAYAKGQRDVQDKSQQLWEKNNELQWQYYKAQTDRYKELLTNRRLDLTQQMDLINSEARLSGDKRMADSANRQDLLSVAKTINDRERLHVDTQKEVRQNRDKLLDSLGKSKEALGYKAWVLEKSKGEVNLNTETDPSKVNDAEQKYPWSQYLKETHDAEAQQKLKDESDKRTQKQADDAEKRKADIEEYKQKLKIKKQVDSGDDEEEKLDPSKPMSDSQKKKLRGLIFDTGNID